MLIGRFMFDLTPIVTLTEYMVLMLEDQIDIVVVHVLPPVAFQMLIALVVAMVDVILEFLYVLIKGVLHSPVCILMLLTVILLILVWEMLQVV